MLNDIINDSFLNQKKHKYTKDNLIIIYDFIDDNEIKQLYDIINLKNNSWLYSSENLSKYLTIEKYNISNMLTKKFQNILKDQSLTASGFYTIHKFDIGDMMPEHVDYNDYKGNLVYGGVLYLNDDYLGGSIYYSDYDIEIKPTAKSLVVHLGDTPHMVKTIENGTRYSMPIFVWKDMSVLFNNH